MKDWNIILHRNRTCKSDDERFWCALALSKLNRIEEALQSLMGGSINFRMQLRCQILSAEIEILRHQKTLAKQRLENIAEQCKNHPVYSSHWTRLIKKVAPPPVQCRSSSWPKNDDDWQRFLSTKKATIEAHMAYLHWLNRQNPLQENLLEACRKTLQIFIMSYHQVHELFVILRARERNWDFLILTLFPLAHRTNPQPKVMWNIWWSACPVSHRSKLEQSMRQQLITRPDFRLDEWLLNKFD